jgi:hypothetical protein
LGNTNWVPRVGGHQSLSKREESYQAKESSVALVFWKYGVKMTERIFQLMFLCMFFSGI